MAEPNNPKIKALDGTIHPLEGSKAIVEQQTSTALPSRAKNDIMSPNDTAPPPGHALTGKQEHCKLLFLRIKKVTVLNLTIDRPETGIVVTAGQIRDFRTSIYNSTAKIRRPVQIRLR